MLDIKIEIKGKISAKEESFRFPEAFNELTFEQFAAYHRFLEEEISTGELLWFFLQGNDEFKAKIPGSRIAQLEDLLVFIYTEPAPEWYMKYLKIEDTELIGPAAEFSNLITGEFVFADTYYTAFMKSVASTSLASTSLSDRNDRNEGEKYMNKCLACLMREPDAEADENSANWKGDKRIIFNENHIEKRAAIIASIPVEMKLAAMFNYGIIRDLIEKRYIWIFQKSTDEGKSKNSGWDKVMRSMCFGDITKLNDIFFIPLYTFMDELNDTIKANSK